MKLFDSDFLKVVLATAGGYAGIMSSLDLLFRVLVGALSAAYIALKLWRSIKKP